MVGSVRSSREFYNKSLQGQGIGKYLLDWCIGLVKFSIMPHVGCRFLVVDSKQESISFYERSGFVLLDTDENRQDEHPLMFFDLYKL